MLRLQHLGTQIPLSMEGILPHRLAGQSGVAIAAIPLPTGNTHVPLGDCFAISGEADDQEILIEGDCRLVKSIGAGLPSGRIMVRGTVGPHAGAGMTGGELHVHGHTGDWLGAEMRGGRIHIHGNAADHVGSVYPGGQAGMRGGAILIDGGAGTELASNMRRGLIAIAGDCGVLAGFGMIAGTIFIFGQTGRRPGAGMKRGTIVCAGPPPVLLPTFRYDCRYRPTFLGLYLKQLRSWQFPVPPPIERASWERHSGDLLALGKGEVLTQPES